MPIGNTIQNKNFPENDAIEIKAGVHVQELRLKGQGISLNNS